MAEPKRPDETGRDGDHERDAALERRRRELDQALASRRVGEPAGGTAAASSGATGYGTALRLSSEFIAGIVVGAGLGWIVDRFAGTSPWGLIVFLLLGFGAGVLNVLRAAGMVADAGIRTAGKPDGEQGRK